MVDAGPQGATVDGGWLARKKLPPAGVITKLALLVGAAGLLLTTAARASAGRYQKPERIERRPDRPIIAGRRRGRYR
jgi:hypothetical protein